MDEEVERHRLIRNSLELELQALRQRMLTVESFTENTNVEQTEDQLSRSGLLLAFFIHILGVCLCYMGLGMAVCLCLILHISNLRTVALDMT